tara:strand:- start:1605 stop:2630 length:1026 start_codon:yes stop_codon:yes gene_type:complete
MKIITIVDSFISNQKIESATLNTISSLKGINCDILFSTTNKVPESIQSKVDYLLYDSRNQLFKSDDYQYFHPWKFWIRCSPDVVSHNFYHSKQRHGLAVMVNLFNSLVYAKNLGYTHFQKILYDIELNSDCLNWLKEIPNVCKSESKKGLIYYNEGGISSDVNGTYMFCEIDHFLSRVPIITCEDDYKRHMINSFGFPKFLIYEKFLYHFLLEGGNNEVLIKNHRDFKNDFKDLKEAEQISALNFDEKYQGCPTRITKIKGTDEYVVLTHNFTHNPTQRRIIVNSSDSTKHEIFHNLPNYSSWSYSNIDFDFESIEVYDGDEFLYKELFLPGEIKNYIEYK